MSGTRTDMPDRAPQEYFAKYRGRVVEHDDPSRKGRLRVIVPQVLGEVAVWAEPSVPYAGKDVGFYAMPEVGAGVWVEFEAGDPSYPIWSGCFWADGDIPAADADPGIKFFRTLKTSIRIDDGNGEIRIENDSGQVITLTSSEITIEGATVRQEASGGKKSVLSAASFKVNDGNLEVL